MAGDVPPLGAQLRVAAVVARKGQSARGQCSRRTRPEQRTQPGCLQAGPHQPLAACEAVHGVGIEVRDGIHVADSASVTVEKAAEFWMKDGERQGLERTTLDQRRQHIDLHIKPLIGSMLLSKLTVPAAREIRSPCFWSCGPALRLQAAGTATGPDWPFPR